MRRNAFPALLLALALCGCTTQTPPPASPSPAAETRPLTQAEIDRVNEAFSPPGGAGRCDLRHSGERLFYMLL